MTLTMQNHTLSESSAPHKPDSALSPFPALTERAGSRSPSHILPQASTSIEKPFKRPPLNKSVKDDSINPVCSNCATTTTPLWRRSESGDILCNACSLYQKMKGCPRPVSLKTDVIKHRNRSKGNKREKAAAAKAAIAAAHAAEKADLDLSYPDPSPRAQSASRTREDGGRKSVPGGSAATEWMQNDAIKRRKTDSPETDAVFLSYHPNAYSTYSDVPPSTPEYSAHPGPYDYGRRPSESGISSSRPGSSEGLFNSRSTSLGRPPALLGRVPAHHAQAFPAYHGQTQFYSGQPHEPWPQRYPPEGSGHITLPPIRSIEADAEVMREESLRGRQKERITLPPIQPNQAQHLMHAPRVEPSLQPTVNFPHAAYIDGFQQASPYALMQHATLPPVDYHNFPQSDSRETLIARPQSATSESSTSSHSPFNSKSPALQNVPEETSTREPTPSLLTDNSKEDSRAPSDTASAPTSSGDNADEIKNLRMRVAELELINSLLTSRVTELEKGKNSTAE